MIAAASQVVLIADSSKFEKTGFVKVCDMAQIHLVITDRSLPAEKLELLHSLNVSVTCV
jgi:DeoR family transcriptional regulator of aga operon